MRKRLTDLNLIEAPIHENDVLHIVDVSDITENPAGSSFKVSIEQLKNKINTDQDVSWGEINGNLTDQTDLITALNLKYNASAFNTDFDTRFGSKSTSNLTEGTNLYFTNNRAISALTGANNSIFNNDSGFLTTETDPIFTAWNRSDGISITESQISDLQNYYLASNPSNFISGIDSSDVTTALGFTPENSANKAQNNGYASLDAGGKVPVTQLPASVMHYLGAWNADTNTPAISDGGDFISGDIYLVSVAGTQDLGSGSITFAEGDWVVYNGSIWEKSINSNAVVSVNSQTGVVSLDADDIDDTTTAHKFVTAGDLINLSNLSGTNTGDQVGDGVTITGTGTAIDPFVALDTYIESWTKLATQWTAEPVSVAYSGGDGDVLEYTYGTTKYYRFIPSIYDSNEDKFYSTYSNPTLSDLIATRGLTI